MQNIAEIRERKKKNKKKKPTTKKERNPPLSSIFPVKTKMLVKSSIHHCTSD